MIAAMNLKETLAKLESMGDEKRRAFNVKNGAGKAKQFGVATGDLLRPVSQTRGWK